MRTAEFLGMRPVERLPYLFNALSHQPRVEECLKKYERAFPLDALTRFMAANFAQLSLILGLVGEKLFRIPITKWRWEQSECEFGPLAIIDFKNALPDYARLSKHGGLPLMMAFRFPDAYPKPRNVGEVYSRMIFRLGSLAWGWRVHGKLAPGLLQVIEELPRVRIAMAFFLLNAEPEDRLPVIVKRASKEGVSFSQAALRQFIHRIPSPRGRK